MLCLVCYATPAMYPVRGQTEAQRSKKRDGARNPAGAPSRYWGGARVGRKGPISDQLPGNRRSSGPQPAKQKKSSQTYALSPQRTSNRVTGIPLLHGYWTSSRGSRLAGAPRGRTPDMLLLLLWYAMLGSGQNPETWSNSHGKSGIPVIRFEVRWRDRA